ncbi:uncharacterized protein EV422DRAFT_509328 [Fimicolochytrium jonesii]|uniref:uncharacterized protein n=1 Tax=Fimicolochytrium jonesii TaxID=1396493 RepID=UPI0022FE5817|nr:uncharacterized protein EV422DRAFT_509328 [Fimicolochytrium jonesii]KAI8816901.1 hypothetical protein EV422DRAFT_509328 [Fimicolochytrium jonesii]
MTRERLPLPRAKLPVPLSKAELSDGRTAIAAIGKESRFSKAIAAPITANSRFQDVMKSTPTFLNQAASKVLSALQQVVKADPVFGRIIGPCLDVFKWALELEEQKASATSAGEGLWAKIVDVMGIMETVQSITLEGPTSEQLSAIGIIVERHIQEIHRTIRDAYAFIMYYRETICGKSIVAKSLRRLRASKHKEQFDTFTNKLQSHQEGLLLQHSLHGSGRIAEIHGKLVAVQATLADRAAAEMEDDIQSFKLAAGVAAVGTSVSLSWEDIQRIMGTSFKEIVSKEDAHEIQAALQTELSDIISRNSVKLQVAIDDCKNFMKQRFGDLETAIKSGVHSSINDAGFQEMWATAGWPAEGVTRPLFKEHFARYFGISPDFWIKMIDADESGNIFTTEINKFIENIPKWVKKAVELDSDIADDPKTRTLALLKEYGDYIHVRHDEARKRILADIAKTLAFYLPRLAHQLGDQSDIWAALQDLTPAVHRWLYTQYHFLKPNVPAFPMDQNALHLCIRALKNPYYKQNAKYNADLFTTDEESHTGSVSTNSYELWIDDFLENAMTYFDEHATAGPVFYFREASSSLRGEIYRQRGAFAADLVELALCRAALWNALEFFKTQAKDEYANEERTRLQGSRPKASLKRLESHFFLLEMKSMFSNDEPQLDSREPQTKIRGIYNDYVTLAIEKRETPKTEAPADISSAVRLLIGSLNLTDLLKEAPASHNSNLSNTLPPTCSLSDHEIRSIYSVDTPTTPHVLPPHLIVSLPPDCLRPVYAPEYARLEDFRYDYDGVYGGVKSDVSRSSYEEDLYGEIEPYELYQDMAWELYSKKLLVGLAKSPHVDEEEAQFVAQARSRKPSKPLWSPDAEFVAALRSAMQRKEREVCWYDD